MTDVATILRQAADLIEPEGAWTQGAWARDRCGVSVTPSSFTAVCFCAGEAIWRLAGADEDARRTAVQALAAIVGEQGVIGGVGAFNDAPARTQAEVVAALRAAANKAEAS